MEAKEDEERDMNGLQENETSTPSEQSSEVPIQPATPASPPSARYIPPVRAVAPHRQRKSPLLACLLSLLPGIGQVYVGHYKLGFLHNIVFASTIMILSMEIEAIGPLFGIFLAFFFVYNIVDAGRRAALYNLALEGAEGIELPQEMDVKLPSFGGSLAGGLALMVLGVLLLTNTLWGMSLAWVENWWPVAPIMMGAYLVVKAAQERRQTGDDVSEAAGE